MYCQPIAAECSESTLVEGEPPPDLAPCGSTIGGASTGLELTNLTAGTDYAFAVAAFDNLGNPGPLSNVSCATAGAPPELGGGCSSGRGLPTALPLGLGALALIARAALALVLGARRAPDAACHDAPVRFVLVMPGGLR